MRFSCGGGVKYLFLQCFMLYWLLFFACFCSYSIDVDVEE